MSQPIDGIRSSFAPSPPIADRLHRGANVLSDPVSPHRTVPTVDRTRVDPRLVQAAEGMESMFLDYLMKVMRQTVPKNEMDLESSASQVYRSMLDSEVAERAARRGGIGLADQIIAYMMERGYNLSEGQGNPPKEKP